MQKNGSEKGRKPIIPHNLALMMALKDDKQKKHGEKKKTI